MITDLTSPSEEPSSRQVSTFATIANFCHRQGLSCTDADLIAEAVSHHGYDADTAKRCLDQLKADGRYQQIFSE